MGALKLTLLMLEVKNQMLLEMKDKLQEKVSSISYWIIENFFYILI